MEATWMEEGGYYLVMFKGRRTLASMTTLMEEVRLNAESTGAHRYLFDLRNSTEGMNVADKFSFGTHLAIHFGGPYVLSVVIRKQDITGFLENVSLNRGAIRLRITDDEAEAVAFASGPPS